MAAGSREGTATVYDSHAHLSMSAFNADRQQVIDRVRNTGVSFLEVGYDERSSVLAVRLSRAFKVFCSVGIHPHYAGSDAGTDSPRDSSGIQLRWEKLRKLIAANRDVVKAIGEIGLDFFRNLSQRDEQIACFEMGLSLARELHMPVIIHQRDAMEEVLDVLERLHPGTPLIFHCFAGDIASARRCLQLGGYLSFGGPLTYPRNWSLRELVRFVPSDRMLVETDSPYLPPQSKRGSRNEPVYVLEVLGLIASLTGKTLHDVSTLTLYNAAHALCIEPDEIRLPEPNSSSH